MIPAMHSFPPQERKRRIWPWMLLTLLLLFALGIGALVLFFITRSPNVPNNTVLKIELQGPLPEYLPQRFPESLLTQNVLTVKDHLDNLKKAASDRRIRGVVLKIGTLDTGWAKIEELRDAIAALRFKGKFAIAFSEGMNEHGYYLALACDEIYMPPEAFFEMNGLVNDVYHYPGLLEKLGIGVQYFRYGKYKSQSGETIGQKALSEPVKEMINYNLDMQYNIFVEAVAKARKLTNEQVMTLVDTARLKAEWARDNKLIDGVVYWDEVETKVKQRTGVAEDKKLPTIKPSVYRGVTMQEAGVDEGRHKIALIYSVGLIVAGTGGIDPFSGDAAQGTDPIIAALRQASEDQSIKAIIFRVDSPGGAGLGCDLVRREIEKIKQKKPIIVSMSDVAASGGYWVSMDATAIVAQPSTITGSIGIFSVIPNLQEMSNKLALNPEVFKRGAHADQIIGARPMTPEEAKVFDEELLKSYNFFVSLAAKGRGKTHEQMEEVAQGRSWLGQKALELGLVDKLGGFETAIALAKEKAQIPAGESVKLQVIERSRGLLAEIFGGDEEEQAARALHQMIRASGLAPLFKRIGHITPLTPAMLERHHLFALAEYEVRMH
jgi:protease-4